MNINEFFEEAQKRLDDLHACVKEIPCTDARAQATAFEGIQKINSMISSVQAQCEEPIRILEKLDTIEKWESYLRNTFCSVMTYLMDEDCEVGLIRHESMSSMCSFALYKCVVCCEHLSCQSCSAKQIENDLAQRIPSSIVNVELFSDVEEKRIVCCQLLLKPTIANSVLKGDRWSFLENSKLVANIFYDNSGDKLTYYFSTEFSMFAPKHHA